MPTKSDEYNVKFVHISLKCSISLFRFYLVEKQDTCSNFSLFVEEIGPFKIQHHRTKSTQKILMQWRIQDFPNGGASPKGEDINLQNCMKMKRSGLREMPHGSTSVVAGTQTLIFDTPIPRSNFLYFHTVFGKN